MLRANRSALLLLSAATLPCVAQSASGPALKINQIQVIGSHNSYHAGLAPNAAKLLKARNPQAFDSLDYAHASLTKQLDGGVRQIELDIYSDAQGGHYAHMQNAAMLTAAGMPADPDPYPAGLMAKPGFKVMHVLDVDTVSNCQPFVACLQQVRAWSQAHPDHIPVFILVETKQGTNKLPNGTQPEPFTPAAFDALDAEIRSVFSSREMITPDDVRGSYPTLNAAVLAGNWPTLESSRGKVVFLLDQRNVTPMYLQGHPSLRGRVLFTNGVPGAPDAAFVERNEGPVTDIRELVRQGYLIRARADSDTKQARTDDTTVRDAMLGSGAQIVSTDYPASEPARWPGHYVVALPGNAIVRCDPVNAPAGCAVTP